MDLGGVIVEKGGKRPPTRGTGRGGGNFSNSPPGFFFFFLGGRGGFFFFLGKTHDPGGSGKTIFPGLGGSQKKNWARGGGAPRGARGAVLKSRGGGGGALGAFYARGEKAVFGG